MKKLSTMLAMASMAILPITTFAIELPRDAEEEGIPDGITTFSGFIDVFDTLITWLFTILLVLAVIFIILAAFKYLTAGGEEEKIKKAHQMIIYAIVAIAVAFLAQGVSFVVGELLDKGNAGVL